MNKKNSFKKQKTGQSTVNEKILRTTRIKYSIHMLNPDCLA